MQKDAVRGFRWTETILGVGGLALLGWMCSQVGFRNILDHLSELGWTAAFLLILFYGLFHIFFCAAWHVLLKGQSAATFYDLLIAYTAGDAINMTVPSANLAGEPVKVMLLEGKVPRETAICSVTVYKFSDILSLTIFSLTGWIVQLIFHPMPMIWNVPAGVVIGGMTGTCALLYYIQNRGMYGPLGQWLSRWGLARFAAKLGSTEMVDKQVSAFYKSQPGPFALSLFYNFLAWFGGVFEIMIFARMTGHPCSFGAALTIETFSMLVNNVAFIVPGRLGVGEAGRVLFFQLLGFPGALGLSYGIIRRIRELAWISAGLAILLFRKKSAPVTAPTVPNKA